MMPDGGAALTPDPAVMAALEGRRSVRAFRPDPVPLDVVRRILLAAGRAPSGTNTQPWRAHVVLGPAKAALEAALLAAHESGEAGHVAEYEYYPDPWPEPYLARRRKVGWDLYGLLGIGRGDAARMHAQAGRNYQFFGAPVGLVFTIDRRLRQGSWLDYGFFLQGVAVAARAYGLDTCAQAAFAQFHLVLRAELGIDAGEVVVCGMALGVADLRAVENGLVTERAGLEDWVRVYEEDGGMD